MKPTSLSQITEIPENIDVNMIAIDVIKEVIKPLFPGLMGMELTEVKPSIPCAVLGMPDRD
jgi:hypothetical protein